MQLLEATIEELREALDSGETTSVELVAGYLRRIAAYDHHGTRLNAVPILSPTAFSEARAADLRRAEGKVLSPLDGIPYTAKDSYKVKGLPVASGSPAFANFIASEDAFSISKLCEAGAILLGLTNMPPMANGGMQRGVYGRAESPYNPAYLTSAWASGSSNGSGTATAASFAAFGLGEETWSSGRAPANNNGLCAYTPSWGVISMRGNWPLVPTMDVVVPHTRTMKDMLELLDVMVQDDATSRGDFWRVQDEVKIPASSQLRPSSYRDLAPSEERPLGGLRIGVPSMYLGRPAPNETEVPTRDSVVELAETAMEDLRALGAEVFECDFPLMRAYEGRYAKLGAGFQGSLAELGFVPEGFAEAELKNLCTFALDDFIRANAEVADNPEMIQSLLDVNPELVFPRPHGQIEDEYGDDFGMGDYVNFAREDGVRSPAEIKHVAEGLRGLNRARQELLEDWMDEQSIDFLAFPTCADIAPADADSNQDSHDLAWRNGTWVANGNLAIRHLGIPTVTVPMGIADDIAMPFGLTLAGKGWDDNRLLAVAAAFDAEKVRRTAPSLTPELSETLGDSGVATGDDVSLNLSATLAASPAGYILKLDGQVPAGTKQVNISVNGKVIDALLDGQMLTAETTIDTRDFTTYHSHWRPAYGTLTVATVHGSYGTLGTFLVTNGV